MEWFNSKLFGAIMVCLFYPLCVSATQATRGSRDAKRGEGRVHLQIRDAEKVLWTANCETSLVASLPAQHIVIYNGEAFNEISCRSYDGKLLWNSHTESAFTPSAFVAGGRTLLVTGRDSLSRSSEKDSSAAIVTRTARSLWVDAFDTARGDALWNSTQAVVGCPVWAGDSVFLDIRALKNEYIGRSGVHHQGLVAYLEQRALKTHALLWSKKLTRLPGKVLAVRPVRHGRSLSVTFSKTEPFFYPSDPSLLLRSDQIVVPLLPGGTARIMKEVPKVYKENPDIKSVTIWVEGASSDSTTESSFAVL